MLVLDPVLLHSLGPSAQLGKGMLPLEHLFQQYAPPL